jgi:hypothetical protein
MIPGCERSENFPSGKPPFTRKDKLDAHMRNIHPAALSPPVPFAGLTAAVPKFADNLVDNIVETNGITGINDTANNGGLMATYGFFGALDWHQNNPDFAATTAIDASFATSSRTNTDGHVDINGYGTMNGQVSFDGLEGITATATTADGFNGNDYVLFDEGFTDSNGFSASSFTGVDMFTGTSGSPGINELISVDDFTSADWSNFVNANLMDI